MNAQKYTQKSLEAVQTAQSLATEYGNQQIEQPHLLLALLSDEAGLIPQLLGNMGITVPSFAAAAKAEVEKLPRVSGSGREQGKIYVAQDVDKCLNTAESIAASMKDEYVSVEHLLLSLIDTANRALKELFRTYNITKEGVLQALTAVRGSQRVTSGSEAQLPNMTSASSRVNRRSTRRPVRMVCVPGWSMVGTSFLRKKSGVRPGGGTCAEAPWPAATACAAGDGRGSSRRTGWHPPTQISG